MAMLAYAPAGFFLLSDSKPGLTLLGLLGVLLVEPLPDTDQWIPGLRHRGTSHSLLCALLVGGVIGTLGWVVGEYVATLLVSSLAGLNTATVGIFANLLQWIAEQLDTLDGRTLASFGFVIGVFGIVVHLLADAITIAGIRPLLPLFHWRVSLLSIRSDSAVANIGLLGVGVLALAAVILVTAPGVGLVGTPASLAPVDAAAGHPQNMSGAATAYGVGDVHRPTDSERDAGG